MKTLINKYRSLSFEEKTIFSSKVSVALNALLAIGKIILSFFYGVFFLVAGIVNVFFMMSKLECYLGERYPNKKSFKYRNIFIGVFLLLAGLEYSIYMARMVFTDIELMQYNAFLAINVAAVSFVELGVAIYGCFKSYGKGHYYRNIKLISLCSALTAIVLTEVALMSFASETDSRLIDGLFGMAVGLIIILIAVYIFIAPKVSIVDREHNVYKLKDGCVSSVVDKVEIKLTDSKFYGNYTYVGKIEGKLIDGHIIKGKSPLLKWNIYIQILIIILSEILIFPYAVGALIFHFKCASLIEKLDNIMLEMNYEKIME